MADKPAPNRITRIMRLATFGVSTTVLVVLLFFASTGGGFAYAVVHIPCQGDFASLAQLGFPAEPVEFTSRDGTIRRGWFSTGSEHPEIAIIVLPGHAGNTRFALADAAIFANAGYSTLIFEHRSCADPKNLSGTGMLEAHDVLGAVDYLDSRPDVEHIGAMGFSAGGTSVLVATGQDERIEAVIAIGGYTSLADDVLDPILTNQHPAEWLYRRFILWCFALFLGPGNLRPAPIDLIDDIAPRPVFLIYGDTETQMGIPLFETAKDPKTLWILPGVTHGQGNYQNAAPEEYPRRMTEFMDQAFNVSRSD